MSFTVVVGQRDSGSVVTLSGELDMASAPRLLAVIEELLRNGRTHIVVDLYELSFCDSAGLNAFVQGEKQCAARGGWLRLTRGRGHVARVLELSGVGEVLDYRPDQR